MVRLHMIDNFGLVHAMERELLAGRLDDARGLAREISRSPEDPIWSKQTALVRTRAAAIAGAKTVEDALRRDAALAEACASCHVDSKSRPEFARWSPLPPDQPTIDARMMRHLWAADRMWEGVIGDADESWRAGLDVLASTPLPTAELGAAREPFARQLQRQALEARRRPASIGFAARATAYGEVLVTCAGCHAALVGT